MEIVQNGGAEQLLRMLPHLPDKQSANLIATGSMVQRTAYTERVMDPELYYFLFYLILLILLLLLLLFFYRSIFCVHAPKWCGRNHERCIQCVCVVEGPASTA